MKTQQKTTPNYPLLTALLVLCALVFHFQGHAQNKDAGELVLKCHFFVMHEDYVERDYSTTLRVVAAEDQNHKEVDQHEIKKKFGSYKITLEVDKHYVIHIDQPGYHSKTIEVSTVGAKKGNHYRVKADVILKEDKIPVQPFEHYALTHISYEKRGDYFKLDEKHPIVFAGVTK